MKSYEKEAVDIAVSWNDDGFNKRDKEICTNLLNYPHIRLWKNKFSIFNNKKDFRSYPSNIKKDLLLLKRIPKIDYIYIPKFRDIYANKAKPKIKIKKSDKI